MKTIAYSSLVTGTIVILSTIALPVNSGSLKKEHFAKHSKPKSVLYKTEKLKVSNKEQDCLAKNIFYEAGIEPRLGKIAVAQVTHNRLKAGHWGSTICKVVYAKSQFSWTLDKKKRNATPKGTLWEESQEVAKEFLAGIRVKSLDTSKFYHTSYIKTPKWVDPNKKIQTIGQHIFYTSAKIT